MNMPYTVCMILFKSVYIILFAISHTAHYLLLLSFFFLFLDQCLLCWLCLLCLLFDKYLLHWCHFILYFAISIFISWCFQALLAHFVAFPTISSMISITVFQSFYVISLHFFFHFLAISRHFGPFLGISIMLSIVLNIFFCYFVSFHSMSFVISLPFLCQSVVYSMCLG